MSESAISSPTISACLIARNEEVLLPDCLRSLLHAVDEIVVVDTGSTDTTMAIAQEFGCRIASAAWNDDFAEARNISLEHATSDWILVIDADERLLTPEALRNTVQQSSPATGAFLLDVESSIQRVDGGTDTYRAGMIRLFRNDKRIRFYGAIHEQVVDRVVECGYSIATSDVQLVHLGYDLSPADMQAKHNRNLLLLNKAATQHPNDGYTLLQRGKTLLALGKQDEALGNFTRASAQTEASPAVQALAFSYAGIVYYQAKEYDKALHNARASIRLLPGQTFAYFICGETLTDRGEFGEALESYLQMRVNARAGDIHASLAGDYRLTPAMLAFRIGRSYAGLRQWGKAEEEFKLGLEADPLDTGCLVGCAEIALRKGEPREAVRMLRLAADHAPEREDIQRYLAIAEGHAVGEQQEQGPSLQQHTEATISGAMITGDNPEGLQRALESLLRMCDEVVVVHTGTSKEVRNVLSQSSARVVVRPWDGDFSAARNAALEQCSGDWIVVLDSDEYADEMAAHNIRKAVQSANAATGGFVVNIEHISDGERSSSVVLRVFRNTPAVRYEGFVHEQVTASLARAGLLIKEQPDVILLHYTAPMDAAKRDKYRSLLAKEVERIGSTAEWPLFQYALLLLNFGDEADFVDSLQALDSYLQHPLMRRDNAAVLLNSYGRHLLSQQAWERLAGIAEDSLAYFPDQREAWWHSVCAYSQLREWHYALHALRILCATYDGGYNRRLVFEKEPSAEVIIVDGQKAVLESGDSELRDVIEVFAMRHGQRNPEQQREQMPGSTAQPDSPQVPAPDAPGRPLLSVSMIVKNEEKFLPGCLESIRGIADEIVIADTGSTDKTVEIAQAYGAIVVHTTWEGDFARARNFSLQHCTGRWILYLDADERLEPAQQQYIRSLIEQTSDDTGAFLCTIVSPHRQRDNSTERHTGAYPRLFRNLGYPTVHFHGRVHEQISPSILTAGKQIASSEIIIHHLGYEQSLQVMQNKVQRNFDLLMRHIREEPTSGQAWLHLGFTLAFMGKNSEAEEALKFALKLGNLNPHLEASAASTLAQISGSARNFAEALHWAEYSVNKAPQQVYGLHLKAYALLYLRRYEEAEKTFIDVLNRLDNPQQRSQAGFDIAIKRDVVVDGLNKARGRAV